MTAHLILVTIGPVQEFIAQARRSRDLWYGSHLLSELSRCVARSIAGQGGELIFPALSTDVPKDAAELEPCPAPTRDNGDSPVNIANIILATLPEGVADPRAVAEHARAELEAFWRDILAQRVWDECEGLISTAPGVADAWKEQIDTFLEFSAAWTPLGDYNEARKRLAKAVAGRKNLRDFEPWMHERGKGIGLGVPKSSLDGARETVLRDPRPKASAAGAQGPYREKAAVKKYRIADGEQLDAVGLVKRAGGETKESRSKNELQFVPIVNVAAAPWLEVARKTCPNEFEKLEGQAKAEDLSRVTRRLECAKVFPWDASIFLENRVWPAFKEQGLLANGDWTAFSKDDEKAWRERVLKWGRDHLDPFFKALRDKAVFTRPYPYVACLVADGDGMGAAIEKIATEAMAKGEDPVQAHRKFSAELAGFARAARKIVEQDQFGSLVYSGGDDVLAFLPVCKALACAEALRRKFAAVMKEACPDFTNEELPTLSVGVGVGHVLESMGDLLDLGREAEKLAKGGFLTTIKQRRNALAVIVDKRSGGRQSWRARWDDDAFGKNPAKRLQDDANLLRDSLATRKVFEIAETLRRMPRADAKLNDDEGDWMDILASDVRRSLRRADAGQGVLSETAAGIDLKGATYKMRHEAMAAWVNRMGVAKTFAEAEPAPPEETAMPEETTPPAEQAA